MEPFLTIGASIGAKAGVGALIYYGKKIKSGEKFNIITFVYGLAGAGVVGAGLAVLGMDVETNLNLIMMSSISLEHIGSNILKPIVTKLTGMKKGNSGRRGR